MKKVVFDTNAYRNFTINKPLEKIRSEIFKVKSLEQQLDITACISVVVLAELLKHLLNKSNINYESCKKSVVASVFHCGIKHEDEEIINFLPTWGNILHSELTGRIQTNNLEYENSILHISQLIAKNPYDIFIENQKVFLEVNIENFRNSKKSIYDAIVKGASYMSLPEARLHMRNNKQNRLKFLNFLQSESFELVLSRIFLEGAKNKYNFTEEINDEIVAGFKKKYLPVIQIQKNLYIKIENGISITDENHKEFNTFYDCFIVAGSLLLDDCVLVTEEKQLIRSFQEAGMGESVMKLNEYLDFIGYQL